MYLWLFAIFLKLQISSTKTSCRKLLYSAMTPTAHKDWLPLETCKILNISSLGSLSDQVLSQYRKLQAWISAIAHVYNSNRLLIRKHVHHQIRKTSSTFPELEQGPNFKSIQIYWKSDLVPWRAAIWCLWYLWNTWLYWKFCYFFKNRLVCGRNFYALSFQRWADHLWSSLFILYLKPTETSFAPDGNPMQMTLLP